MKQTFDYTPILKRKIDEMIKHLETIPEGEHAIRELKIVRFRLDMEKSITSDNILSPIGDKPKSTKSSV